MRLLLPLGGLALILGGLTCAVLLLPEATAASLPPAVALCVVAVVLGIRLASLLPQATAEEHALELPFAEAGSRAHGSGQDPEVRRLAQHIVAATGDVHVGVNPSAVRLSTDSARSTLVHLGKGRFHLAEDAPALSSTGLAGLRAAEYRLGPSAMQRARRDAIVGIAVLVALGVATAWLGA